MYSLPGKPVACEPQLGNCLRSKGVAPAAAARKASDKNLAIVFILVEFLWEAKRCRKMIDGDPLLTSLA